MSSSRRGRGRAHAAGGGGGGGHGGGADRWMASYMDMVTVLMCLFIVLYAMSTVDQGKYEELKNALASGFGQEVSDDADLAEGIVVPPELENETGTDLVALQSAADTELGNLQSIQQRIETGLADRGVQTRIEYVIDERGLTVKFVGTETFFGGNSAELQSAGVTALEVIGDVLVTVPNEISVEGHADSRGTSYPFATDWELSSSRATGVVRFLVEQRALPGSRISSVGYGSARPVAEGEADPAMNRRVDVVVLSDAPDPVRQLLGAAPNA